MDDTLTDDPVAGLQFSAPRGQFTVIGDDVAIGSDTSIWNLVFIGHRVKIGSQVTVGSLVHIGDESEIDDLTQISGGVYLGRGTRIGSNCFVGPGAVFAGDPHPLPGNPAGETELPGVVVEDGAVIGAGARLMAGVVVGRRAVVGMGAVVLEDVPAETVVVGSPARPIYARSVYDAKQRDWADLNR